MFNRYIYEYNKDTATRKGWDFGYGSDSAIFRNCTWDYVESPLTLIDTVPEEGGPDPDYNSFGYMDEGDHNISVYNDTFRGNWNQQNHFLRFGNSTYNDTVRNCYFELRKYSFPDGKGIFINDGDSAAIPTKNIYIGYNTIILKSTNHFAAFAGDSSHLNMTRRGIYFVHNRLHGLSAGKQIWLSNIHGVWAKDNYYNNVKIQ
jgi:hypothetical protein